MVIEDFGRELICIEGNDNVVADAMSRLDTTATELNAAFKKKAPDLYIIAEYYGNEQLQEDIYPVQFKLLQTEHQKDKKLIEKANPPKLVMKSRTFLGA
eukprot:3643945-Ditylum_brightwellii.AAC.1